MGDGRKNHREKEDGASYDRGSNELASLELVMLALGIFPLYINGSIFELHVFFDMSQNIANFERAGFEVHKSVVVEALHALDSGQALFQFVGALLRHSDIQSD